MGEIVDGYDPGSRFSSNPICYAGEFYDNESGMIYLRGRYYDPETRRFITEDPAKDDWNWYTYCGNNPVMFIDPTGLYDRKAVKDYINTWWNDRNSAYYSYTTDCANFVSQCLFAGGIEMKDAWHSYKGDFNSNKFWWDLRSAINSQYWYDWDVSEAWRLAKAQFEFFSNPDNGFMEGEVLQIWSVEGMEYNVQYNNIQIGDLMYFADRENMEIYHATIISKVENGKIYFAGHTSNRYEQDLSNYLDEEMVFVVRIRNDAVKGYIN